MTTPVTTPVMMNSVWHARMLGDLVVACGWPGSTSRVAEPQEACHSMPHYQFASDDEPGIEHFSSSAVYESGFLSLRDPAR